MPDPRDKCDNSTTMSPQFTHRSSGTPSSPWCGPSFIWRGFGWKVNELQQLRASHIFIVIKPAFFETAQQQTDRHQSTDHVLQTTDLSRR